MSVNLALSACPPGTYDWVAQRGGVEHPDAIYRLKRYSEWVDGYLGVVELYRALIGTDVSVWHIDFWGSPPRDRYHQALAGGSLIVPNGDDDWLIMRCLTAEEAQEAAATIEEIAAHGTAHATPEALAAYEYAWYIERYLRFYRALEPGEEVFYQKY